MFSVIFKRNTYDLQGIPVITYPSPGEEKESANNLVYENIPHTTTKTRKVKKSIPTVPPPNKAR